MSKVISLRGFGKIQQHVLIKNSNELLSEYYQPASYNKAAGINTVTMILIFVCHASRNVLQKSPAVFFANKKVM